MALFIATLSGTMSDDRIIELLIRDGLITPADLEQAKDRQRRLHHRIV